jgi:GWxTD domain-containing protein
MNLRLTLWTFLFLLSGAFGTQGKQLSATFDYCNFRASDSTGIFEYYISFHGKSVNYVFTSDGFFQSTIKVLVQILDEEIPIYIDKFELSSPLLKDSSEFSKEYLVQNKIHLPNGSYKFSLVAEDLLVGTEENSPLSLLVPIKVGYETPILQVSDIQTLKSYEKTEGQGPEIKSGFKMLSRNSNYFSEKGDEYRFYAEIYNAESILGAGQSYLVSFSIKNAQDLATIKGAGSFAKYEALPVNPVLGSIDLSEVPSGYYYFSVEVKDRENNSLASNRKFFRRINPAMEEEKEKEFDPESVEANCEIADVVERKNLNFILQGLMPLAEERENNFIDAVVASGDEDQKVNYLCYFFNKRSTVENPALVQFLGYLDRLEISEKKYSTQTMPGYQTDRGRVFIQFGKPNRIDDEWSDPQRQATNNAYIPYEIWLYYKIESPIPQTNVQFVFAQLERANYNYRLIHSNGVGERPNPNWKQEIKARYIIDEIPAGFSSPDPLKDGN